MCKSHTHPHTSTHTHKRRTKSVWRARAMRETTHISSVSNFTLKSDLNSRSSLCVCALLCLLMRYVAVCCGMLQYVAVCCSVLQCIIVRQATIKKPLFEVLSQLLISPIHICPCIVVCCSKKGHHSTTSFWIPTSTPDLAYVYVSLLCFVLQCVTVCCSMFQCVSVCCSVLQFVAVCCSMSVNSHFFLCVHVLTLSCVAVYWSVLQYVVVCCSVLQCVAASCSVRQYVAVRFIMTVTRNSPYVHVPVASGVQLWFSRPQERENEKRVR